MKDVDDTKLAEALDEILEAVYADYMGPWSKSIPLAEAKQAILGLITSARSDWAKEVTQGASEGYQSGNKPNIKQVANLTAELKDALVALGRMYQQYCGPNFGHNFMGAGEYAIDVLEKYGLGDERNGVNKIALDKLEQPKPLEEK